MHKLSKDFLEGVAQFGFSSAITPANDFEVKAMARELLQRREAAEKPVAEIRCMEDMSLRVENVADGFNLGRHKVFSEPPLTGSPRKAGNYAQAPSVWKTGEPETFGWYYVRYEQEIQGKSTGNFLFSRAQFFEYDPCFPSSRKVRIWSPEGSRVMRGIKVTHYTELPEFKESDFLFSECNQKGS